MSKSLGNAIAPEDILKKYGADILRVWVSASNYEDDLRIDYSILEQHAESYRKIRNTFRYLLGNLKDEISAEDFGSTNINELPELEQYMLHKLYVLNENFHKNFKTYSFHNLYKDLLNFCTVDLSAFYFDIRKDTLYCDSLKSNKRKQCLILLKIILECLLSWFAPILSFTTEEIFRLINKNSKSSIHLKKFASIPKEWENKKLSEVWDKVNQIRDFSNISIENKRAEKVIGSSLEAEVEISLKQKLFEIVKKFDFAEICITSKAEVILDNNIQDDIEVKTLKAEGKKCDVCWKIRKGKCERHG
tara:strand:- start:14 stop:925 length:912 start_codon:yes stop_codon:yes gene_type:complete